MRTASARAITAAVLNEPFMVFKVLSYAQKNVGKRQRQDIVEVDTAILMVGTGTLYRNLAPDFLVGDKLRPDIPELTHL